MRVVDAVGRPALCSARSEGNCVEQKAFQEALGTILLVVQLR